MIRMVRQMRDEKKLQCGKEIKSDEPRFFVGCASNPLADPFEFRVRRLAKKVAARVRAEGLDEKTFILAGYGVRNRPGRQTLFGRSPTGGRRRA